MHLDKLYTPGTNRHCTDILCCRKYTGFPSNEDDKAGEWGSYKCDSRA